MKPGQGVWHCKAKFAHLCDPKLYVHLLQLLRLRSKMLEISVYSNWTSFIREVAIKDVVWFDKIE